MFPHKLGYFEGELLLRNEASWLLIVRCQDLAIALVKMPGKRVLVNLTFDVPITLPEN